MCVCVSHVAVYVLQSVSGVGHGQICVQDEAQAAGRLVVMEAVLAGLKGQEALLPAERQQFRTADRYKQIDRQRGRQADRQTGGATVLNRDAPSETKTVRF